MPFPIFWYESNACWGLVDSAEKLIGMLNLQLEHPNNIETIDDFLDKSKESVDATLNFGTSREHRADYTLREFLQERNALDEFLTTAKNNTNG